MTIRNYRLLDGQQVEDLINTAQAIAGITISYST